MRKYLALVLAILTVLSSLAVFASCGGDKATETASSTETSSATESVTESATDTDTETATDTDTETATETDTETATETETETETEVVAVNPEEELETMLAHLWYEYDFTAEGGLDKIKRIDLVEEGLNCATLDGWTKIGILYIPEKKTGNKKWSFSDYLSPVGAMRGTPGGDFSYGVSFNPAMKVFGSINAALYPASSVEYSQVTEEFLGGYSMFVETFTPTSVKMWMNGKQYITMTQSSAKTGTRGELTTSHSVLFLNTYACNGYADDKAVDAYAVYGVKTMYAAAYTYAIQPETVELLYTYYNDAEGTLTGLPEVEVLPLSFEDPESDISFKEDLTASNYDTVITYPYWSANYAAQGGLKGVETVHIRELWDTVRKGKDWGNGAALAGITTSALYYIPEGNYDEQDYMGLMEYNDYDANGWTGTCVMYNLGTGMIVPMGMWGGMVNGTNAVAKEKKVTGWALFVYSFDGAMIKVWLNDELIFVASVEGERYATYGLDHKEHLHWLVVNGWVSEFTEYGMYNTIDNALVDLYTEYGIYCMKAEMYAYAANEQAAHHFYELADIPE